MKFATLVIFACLKCVTVKSQGSLRVEDKLSTNKAATAAELTQVYDPKINDDAIVNADERAEADWGLKSSVREAMVCTQVFKLSIHKKHFCLKTKCFLGKAAQNLRCHKPHFLQFERLDKIVY
jgi:hypothetical protein